MTRVAMVFAASLVAVVLVGWLITAVSSSNGANPLDRNVLEWFVAHRSDALTHATRAITNAGGSIVVTPLALLVAAALVATRRRRLAAYLVTVVIGASLLSSTAKALVGRQRPALDLRLAGTGDSAFPSGHSTQAAATYVALAIVIAAIVSHQQTRRLVWAMSSAVIILVGVSRLYLGVHWTTDVLAGWALGVGWALGAAAAFRIPAAPIGRVPGDERDLAGRSP